MEIGVNFKVFVALPLAKAVLGNVSKLNNAAPRAALAPNLKKLRRDISLINTLPNLIIY